MSQTTKPVRFFILKVNYFLNPYIFFKPNLTGFYPTSYNLPTNQTCQVLYPISILLFKPFQLFQIKPDRFCITKPNVSNNQTCQVLYPKSILLFKPLQLFQTKPDRFCITKPNVSNNQTCQVLYPKNILLLKTYCFLFRIILLCTLGYYSITNF